MTGCSSKLIYESKISQQSLTTSPILIIICIILPIQLIFMIWIMLKGYKKYRKMISKKSFGNIKTLDQHIDNTGTQIKNQQNQEVMCKNNDNENNNNIVENFILNPASLCSIIIFIMVFIVLTIICIVMLLLAIFAIYQAIDYNYDNASCILTQKINQFQKGSGNWIGLENILPNITQLNLVLNTRLQVSINAIKGLLLNGTVATIKPGIGFSNGTSIPVVNSQTTLSLNKVVITSNVASYIDAGLRQWLFRNSSLSGSAQFPVCQKSSIFPIQHPLNSGSTIELDYMSSTCTKATQQVDNLVENGNQVDKLLVRLQQTLANKTNFENNLSTINSIYSPIASRSNQYQLEFGNFDINTNFTYYLPIIALCGYAACMAILVLYILFSFCSSFCHCCKCECDCDTENSESNSSETSKKNSKKYSEISFNYPKVFVLFFLMLNLLFGISAYLYAKLSIQSKQFCQNFESIKSNNTFLENAAFTNSQKSLLQPIQQCTSGQNQYFLEQNSLLTSQQSVKDLYLTSLTYNLSTPVNIYDSVALNLPQTLKSYLFHLETMPIKSTSFNLISILADLNSYSNGTDLNSQQKAQCSKPVIQDEYVYNAIDCRHKLMDLTLELSTTQPRCIIIPTYNGTPGTTSTKLNMAQHNFVLNTSCPSIDEMFNPLNTNCYLNKRLKLLKDQNCSTSATQLGARLQNLVKFSKDASSYTDIYIQNMRNLFGAYLVMSSNLTQFFAGTNMSQILKGFGILSSNLLNMTKCSEVSNRVNDIQNSICPTSNTLSMLFFDAVVWTLVAFFIIFLQSLFYYLIDIKLRLYRLDRQHKKIKDYPEANIQIESTKRNIQNKKQLMIEVSQETLIRNNNQPQDNEFNFQDQIKYPDLQEDDNAQIHQNVFLQRQNSHYFNSPKRMNRSNDQTNIGEQNRHIDDSKPTSTKLFPKLQIQNSQILQTKQLNNKRKNPRKRSYYRQHQSSNNVPKFDNIIKSDQSKPVNRNQLFNIDLDSQLQEEQPSQVKKKLNFSKKDPSVPIFTFQGTSRNKPWQVIQFDSIQQRPATYRANKNFLTINMVDSKQQIQTINFDNYPQVQRKRSKTTR